MKTSICVVVLLTTLLIGCGKEFDGTYRPVPKRGVPLIANATLVFKSGHKVNMSVIIMGMNMNLEAKYEVDGKDFKYTMGGVTQIAEITEWDGHECINFGDMSPYGFMCKDVPPNQRRIHD
jgi:hypothetical protein